MFFEKKPFHTVHTLLTIMKRRKGISFDTKLLKLIDKIALAKEETRSDIVNDLKYIIAPKYWKAYLRRSSETYVVSRERSQTFYESILKRSDLLNYP